LNGASSKPTKKSNWKKKQHWHVILIVFQTSFYSVGVQQKKKNINTNKIKSLVMWRSLLDESFVAYILLACERWSNVLFQKVVCFISSDDEGCSRRSTPRMRERERKKMANRNFVFLLLNLCLLTSWKSRRSSIKCFNITFMTIEGMWN
jgi:hypothetical protein